MLHTCLSFMIIMAILPISSAEEPIDRLAAEVGGQVYRNDKGAVTGFRTRKTIKGDRKFEADDLPLILAQPDLTYLMLENPLINEPEIAQIGQMTQLEHLVLWLGGGAPHIPSTALLELGSLQNLRTLDMKHSFSVKGEPCIQDMATFPALEKLVVDTVHSNAELIPFVQRHPGIRWLRIHRSSMTNDDFAQVAAALPNLEILEIKPRNQKQAGIIGPPALRHLQGLDKLRWLYLSHEWYQAPWEGGLEHLVDIPSLEAVQIAIGEGPERLALLERLAEARPELWIFGARKPHVLLHGTERWLDDAAREQWKGPKSEILSTFPKQACD